MYSLVAARPPLRSHPDLAMEYLVIRVKPTARPPLFLSSACRQRGFTLLEVLIAIAILAISLSAIFGSQAQSLSLATEAQFNIYAATLAKAKLAEYESGITPLENGDGDFGDDFPGYTWKVEVEEADLQDILPSLADPGDPLQRLDLIVSWENESFTYGIRCYVKKENAP
jgi:general secretion pathway protein I